MGFPTIFPEPSFPSNKRMSIVVENRLITKKKCIDFRRLLMIILLGNTFSATNSLFCNLPFFTIYKKILSTRPNEGPLDMSKCYWKFPLPSSSAPAKTPSGIAPEPTNARQPAWSLAVMWRPSMAPSTASTAKDALSWPSRQWLMPAMSSWTSGLATLHSKALAIRTTTTWFCRWWCVWRRTRWRWSWLAASVGPVPPSCSKPLAPATSRISPQRECSRCCGSWAQSICSSKIALYGG